MSPERCKRCGSLIDHSTSTEFCYECDPVRYRVEGEEEQTGGLDENPPRLFRKGDRVRFDHFGVETEGTVAKDQTRSNGEPSSIVWVSMYDSAGFHRVPWKFPASLTLIAPAEETL